MPIRSFFVLVAMAVCGQVGGDDGASALAALAGPRDHAATRATGFGAQPERPAAPPLCLVCTLRGGGQARTTDGRERDENVRKEESPSASVTPDSDALMQEAEGAPLSPEQLAQLRALPVADLLPLGEPILAI
jgi:hypothetical protein